MSENKEEQIAIYGTPLDVSMFMISAFRYALGRQTYIVSSTVKMLVENMHALRERDKILIQQEITEAKVRGMISSYDKEQWDYLYDKVDESLLERKQ